MPLVGQLFPSQNIQTRKTEGLPHELLGRPASAVCEEAAVLCDAPTARAAFGPVILAL